MRKAIILCALLCAAGIVARADIQQDVINRDPAGASGGGGGGTVTVGESDGSPSVSDASTISFDQSKGFTVTDEGGGEAEVGLSLGAALVTYDDTNDGYPAGVLNVEDALDALVNRERPAHEEQQQSDDHRPEVHDPMMPERMVVGLWTRCLLHAQQQQQLIGTIGSGVNRLGEHRTGTGPGRGGKLRHGDAAVGA